jgi:hypothetical protein
VPGRQALAGAGNTAELVGTDTLIRQTAPAELLGRAFGAVYASAQLASAIAYSAEGPLVALTGPRATFSSREPARSPAWPSSGSP